MARIRAKARILERTITAGNGPYTLTAVDNSYSRFASLCAIGDTIEITVVEPGVAFWTGTGTYSATNQMTLTTVEETVGTLGSGSKEVMAGPLASGVSPLGVGVTGGSGTAYTLTTVKPIASNFDGFTAAFTPGTTNTGAVTLAVDGGTARPLRFLTGVDLPSGVLISGSLYQATLRSTEWLLHASPLAQPFLVPLGGIIDYAGLTAPSGNFALPQGQAISRATYAALFSLIGTTYGAGDGSTTFAIPDMVGRMGAMRDVGSARLSSTYFGGNPANLGAVGGSESSTLLTANLPAYTPAGTVTNGAITATGQALAAGNAISNSSPSGAFSQVGASVSTSQLASTFAGTAQGGVSTPVRTVPPIIILNKIMRIL